MKPIRLSAHARDTIGVRGADEIVVVTVYVHYF